MKHVKLFEDYVSINCADEESFELSELNKVGKYYRDNPSKLLQDPNSSLIYKPGMFTPSMRPTLTPDKRTKYSKAYIHKLSLQSGIAVESLIPALACLDKFKWAMGGYNLPPKYHKVLRKLTVFANNIPQTLWRGMQVSVPSFSYDDNPQAALDAFIDTWAPGKKPPLHIDRATSWSTRKSVAMKFMSKHETGERMRVLLRYDNPSLEDIIVDTRQLKHDHFIAEREIVLASSATGYVVDSSFYYDSRIPEFNVEYEEWFNKQTSILTKLQRDYRHGE